MIIGLWKGQYFHNVTKTVTLEIQIYSVRHKLTYNNTPL